MWTCHHYLYVRKLQINTQKDPEFYGWKTVEDILLPHWFDGEELPLKLKDVEFINESDSEDDVSDIEDNISDIESDIMSDSVDE